VFTDLADGPIHALALFKVKKKRLRLEFTLDASAPTIAGREIRGLVTVVEAIY